MTNVHCQWFNAYATEEAKPGPSWVHPGDLLVHFAGVGDRPTQMNIWADKSEKLSYKWNTPLAQTTYSEEIDRFWNRTKSVYEARMNHWTKETKHLQASFAKANETITEWGSTSEKQSKNFLSMVQAQKNAVYYLGNITKYNNEIMKEDLYELDKVVKELDDVRLPPVSFFFFFSSSVNQSVARRSYRGHNSCLLANLDFLFNPCNRPIGFF